MKTVTTSASEYNTISLADAKRHLKESRSEFDHEVAASLRAAIDWAEQFTSRTLRTAVERTTVFECWEDLNQSRLPYQPVLAVSEVSYIDESGGSQIVASGNYRLIRSTNVATVFELDTDYTRPTVAERSDVISVTYTTGYAAITDIPPLAIAAIKMMLSVFYMDMNERDVNVWVERAESCLNQIDWGWL
jgi:uncharacterized phiE125 gp8 family phage protein